VQPTSLFDVGDVGGRVVYRIECFVSIVQPCFASPDRDYHQLGAELDFSGCTQSVDAHRDFVSHTGDWPRSSLFLRCSAL
jgi:hypothetical protein